MSRSQDSFLVCCIHPMAPYISNDFVSHLAQIVTMTGEFVTHLLKAKLPREQDYKSC